MEKWTAEEWLLSVQEIRESIAGALMRPLCDFASTSSPSSEVSFAYMRSLGQVSKYIRHHSLCQTPLPTHHSILTTHHSPLPSHLSPLTTHHSPLTTHHS